MTDEEAKALAAKFFEDKPTPPALHTDRQREVEKLPASSQADAKCEHGSMFEGCPICYERVTGQQDAEVDAVRELCTADMPSDEIRATNGYTYVLKSAYDRVVAELAEANAEIEEMKDVYYDIVKLCDASGTEDVRGDLEGILDERDETLARSAKLVEAAREVIGAELRCFGEVGKQSNNISISIKMLADAIAEWEQEK